MTASEIRAWLLRDNMGDVDHALSHACRSLAICDGQLEAQVSAGYVRRSPKRAVREPKAVPPAVDIPAPETTPDA